MRKDMNTLNDLKHLLSKHKAIVSASKSDFSCWGISVFPQ